MNKLIMTYQVRFFFFVVVSLCNPMWSVSILLLCAAIFGILVECCDCKIRCGDKLPGRTTTTCRVPRSIFTLTPRKPNTKPFPMLVTSSTETVRRELEHFQIICYPISNCSSEPTSEMAGRILIIHLNQHPRWQDEFWLFFRANIQDDMTNSNYSSEPTSKMTRRFLIILLNQHPRWQDEF